MIRALTALTVALGLAGAAHAEVRQVSVDTHGLSARAASARLYDAAVNVCASAAPTSGWDEACVADTYADAVRHSRTAQPARLQPTRTALLSGR